MSTPVQLTVNTVPLGELRRSTEPGARPGRARGRPADISRRRFLQRAGAAGVATGLASAAAGTSPKRRVSDEWMGMLTDLTLCVGCRKCEWACKQANGLRGPESIDDYEDESVFEERRRTDADNFTVVNRFTPDGADGPPIHVKQQCMHCFEPACASACLVAAFRKSPQGPVLYDDSVCIGCRYCMVACPFGLPAYTYDNPGAPVVRKCTMCFERIAKEGGRPACAEICPVEAITFGKRSELLAIARSRIEGNPERYVDHIYGEHEAGGTCWLYLSGAPFEQLGFPTNVRTTPYPELTKGFLSSVPLVLTIWPALLMGAYAFTKHREHLAENGAETTGHASVDHEERIDG